MPKDEHPTRLRKLREELDRFPYTKHSTTHPGEANISPDDTGGTGDRDLPLVLREASGSGSSGSHLVPTSIQSGSDIVPIGSQTAQSYSSPRPESLGSFFQMSRNVNVNGGEFTSSQLHHTNLTINIGRNSSSADSVDISGVLDPRHESVLRSGEGPRAVHYGVEEGPRGGGGGGNSRDSTFGQNDSLSGQELPQPRPGPSPPVHKSSEIYFRHLAAKGRGSPLWIPEPNTMLPIEYQRRGIDIGDVGIITDSGGFDFLFNICLPVGHPINPESMPDNFKPLAYPAPRDVYANLEFKADSYLASSLMETSRRDGGESPGLVFESSAIDGAVLTMPTGSRSTNLRNVTAFRKYAIANAERWYQYANEVRGREARNGDLRLVVGYHSASAWGMAAFANLSEQSAFRLRFIRPQVSASGSTQNVAEGDSTRSSGMRTAYQWECSGTAVEVKSGPDPREVELLQPSRGDEPSDDSDSLGQRSSPTLYENQCLFIRTINATLQDAVWDKLSAGWDLDMALDDDTSYHAHPEDTETPTSTRTSHNLGQDGDSTRQSFGSNRVHLSSLPGALDGHPSMVINKCLLKERPDARVAVTEDMDWISVLASDETVLPEPEILSSRIMSTQEICEEEDAVFFKCLEFVSPPSTPPPLGERILSYPDSLSRLVDPRLLSRFSSTHWHDEEGSNLSPTSSSPPTSNIPTHKPSDPERAYPTPVLYGSRRNLDQEPSSSFPASSSSTSGLSAEMQPEPEVSVPFPQRSGSHPPSTPPSQTSSAKAAKFLTLADAETLYPTPEMLPLNLRR